MREEYNFTLTLPLNDVELAVSLLREAGSTYPQMRISRKPDRKGMARFYLSFPYQGMRLDLGFQDWLASRKAATWEIFGPNYGVWGFS